MLTTQETINLYLVINKLMYKYAELGKKFYTSRNKDVDSKEFKLILEVSLAIDFLLDTDYPIVQDGLSYPNFSQIEGQTLQQWLDYFSYKFNLNPIPYLEFPNNSTKFIEAASGVTINGTSLPSGGGPGFFLTKDISGNLYWSDERSLISDFNEI